jgi:hypothetical protein
VFINNLSGLAGQFLDPELNSMHAYFQQGSHLTTFDAPDDPLGSDRADPTGLQTHGQTRSSDSVPKQLCSQSAIFVNGLEKC